MGENCHGPELHARGVRVPGRDAAVLPIRRPRTHPPQGPGRAASRQGRTGRKPAHPERARPRHAALAGGLGRAGLVAGADLPVSGRDAAGRGAQPVAVQRVDGRPGDRRVRQRGAQAAASCRASPTSTTGGARASPSPAPGPTSPACAPRRGGTATTTSSTARRPGPPMAQHADWIFCLVRTDPAAKKQEGISFLLIDMQTNGIEVRPIQTIDGGAEVNEVWFDEVVVPAENLVGQENKGWDYAKFLLGNERTGIARVGVSQGAADAHPAAGDAGTTCGTAGDRGPPLPREAGVGGDRAEGAGDDPAPRRRRRAQAGARQAEPGLVDPQAEGHRSCSRPPPSC